MTNEGKNIKPDTISEAYFRSEEAYDDLLFHYTEYTTAMEHVLHERLLKFSSLKWSHDPLEYNDYEYSAASNAAGDRAVAFESLHQQLRRGQAENDIVKKRAKVACFSIDDGLAPIDLHHKGCYRSRMWTQYSRGHTGICIVFSKQRLLSCIRRQLLDEDVCISGKVNYQNIESKRFDLVFKRPWEESPEPDKAVLENAGIHFFSKLEDYHDEAEFRIVYWRAVPDLSSNAEFLDVKDAFAGILVGNSFHTRYRPVVKKQAAELHVPVFQITWYLGTPLWEEI